MDKLTKEQRYKCMKAVKSKDSKIEVRLRLALWHRGYRYQKNCSKLYGRPDIVIMKYKIAIFCDSEFWHGYDWETRKQDFKSRKDFWILKIERNIERDKEVNARLSSQGYTVLRFWGKNIYNNLDVIIKEIEDVIKIKAEK